MIQPDDQRLKYPILNIIKDCGYGSELYKGICVNTGLNWKSKVQQCLKFYCHQEYHLKFLVKLILKTVLNEQFEPLRRTGLGLARDWVHPWRIKRLQVLHRREWSAKAIKFTKNSKMLLWGKWPHQFVKEIFTNRKLS